MDPLDPPAGSLSRVGVVLLRPKSPGNVGSVARAMKNLGFGRLVIADPMRYDDPGHFDAEGRRMAWRAADLLERRETAPDLGSALAGFTLVAGTTSRPPEGVVTLPPRALAARIAAHLAGDPEARAALLFGQEDIGLTRDTLCRCEMLGVIPSSQDYPSLNLAQAALLFLYETRLALLEPPRGAATPDCPTHAAREAFFARLETALDTIDFFQGSGRAHMMRELRRIFNRAALSRRELAILEGMVHRIEWAGRRHG